MTAVVSPAGVVSVVLRRVSVCLHQDEAKHKKSGGRRDDVSGEVLRVPVALAMIKLLQHLPRATLEKALSG